MSDQPVEQQTATQPAAGYLAPPSHSVPSRPAGAPLSNPPLSALPPPPIYNARPQPQPGAPSGFNPGQHAQTAQAAFTEVRKAVKVSSKREPYALLAVVSLVGTFIWIIWPEGGKIGAQNLKLWTVFVLGSAAMIFAPMTRKVFRLTDERAWQFAVGGAAGMGFAWVAFLLPSINSNQAFFGTIATAAAGLAAWTAPGRGPSVDNPEAKSSQRHD